MDTNSLSTITKADPPVSTFSFTTAGASAPTTMTPYQSVSFIEDYLARNVSILEKITKMPVKAQNGKLPVLNVTERNWRVSGTDRSKNEYVEGAYQHDKDGRIDGIFSEIPFNLTKIMADVTITHDFLRFNIEQEGAEDTILKHIARRHSEDLTDLMFCGGLEHDTKWWPNWGDNHLTQAKANINDPFYNIAPGLILKLYHALKELKLENQIIDAKQGFAETNDAFSDEVFYDMMKSISDSDILTGDYVWLCHPSVKILLMEVLKSRNTVAGDLAILGKVGELTPFDIPFESVFCFPKDIIILADPKDFTLAYYDEIAFRKTDEGQALIQADSRYYVWYYWLDFLVTAPKKMAMAINVPLKAYKDDKVPDVNTKDEEQVPPPKAPEEDPSRQSGGPQQQIVPKSKRITNPTSTN